MSAREIVEHFGGSWYGTYGTFPAPGHSRRDRSVSIKDAPGCPDGILINTFSGADPLAIKHELRARGLLEKRETERSPIKRPQRTTRAASEADRIERARWLWRSRQPIDDPITTRYLRETRGITCELSATLAYLPPRKPEHHPALITAFGFADEPEPSVLRIREDAVIAVHLILLSPDGHKAGTERDKFSIGCPSGTPIMLAPSNDLLGLVITEGVEDALSIHEATGLGAWAAGGATFLPALAGAVPEWIDCVTIAVDANAAGQDNSTKLARGLRARGIHVDLLKIEEASSP